MSKIILTITCPVQEWKKKSEEVIEATGYQQDKIILHPQEYRDIRLEDCCWKYYKQPWYKRLFKRKPRWRDIEVKVEKEIAKMYARQLYACSSELFYVKLKETQKQREKRND